MTSQFYQFPADLTATLALCRVAWDLVHICTAVKRQVFFFVCVVFAPAFVLSQAALCNAGYLRVSVSIMPCV